MNKPWNIFDYFDVKSGSKNWPSDDPEDSPFDLFTCKHCGVSRSIQVYGGFHVDGPSLCDQAKAQLTDHTQVCPVLEEYKFEEREASDDAD